MTRKLSLGIDLGTSNSCLSLCAVDGGPAGTIPITQILAPAVVGEKPLLPSVLYLPAPGEYAPGSFKLPWDAADAQGSIVGSFARERGATVPDRVVTSAKSWLCNPDVDRRAPILPWRAEFDDATVKVSPFEATRRYLAHLRHAAEAHLAQRNDGATLADCQVVLTVPASFDEVARTLTHEAALAVGLDDVILLEEPQAAFYAWIHQSIAPGTVPWTEQVAPGDLVLVCDIGGGTADFSLIAVAAAPAGLSRNLELHRVAVGEHILLGGDNMDLALAYHLRGKLEEDGHELDAWQFQALVHNAREAKERLLGNAALAETQVAVPSRGSRLFARTLATTLTRDEVVAILTDGYFPLTAATDLPTPRKSVGLQEYGLDYATEPAVSRHLARFLRRALENVRSDADLATRVGAAALGASVELLRPTAVLFNGGVFEAAGFRERVVEVLRGWFGADHTLKELANAGLDVAVSRGAAYYGAVRASGKGIAIQAGTSRSYYLGLESPAPAVPGYLPPVKGVCVVPQGTKEGTDLELPGREFGLVTGEAVQFRFFASDVRAGDRVGSIVANAAKALDELPGLSLTLPPLAGGTTGQVVQVSLHPCVTEVGTLELWLHHQQSPQRWKLDFKLRAGE